MLGVAVSERPTDVREDAIWQRLKRRLFTNGGSGVGVTVPLAATSRTVAFDRLEPDARYAVTVLPSWNTTTYIAAADKATTGFTVHFGSAAPANATIDFNTYRAG